MTQEHPITPPQWQVDAWCKQALAMGADVDSLFVQAYQGGADQELEACCEWFQSNGYHEFLPDKLRASRRPKPPSLKAQALEALVHILTNSSTQLGADTIRRALEQLDD